MDARQQILETIRQYQVAPVELPDPTGMGTTYSDPHAKFDEILEAVGGRTIRAAGPQALDEKLEDLGVYRDARRIVSRVPGVGRATVDLDSVREAHELDKVDLMVLPGEFSVAENGAVWVTDQGIRHRVAYVIAEHLVLVVPASEMVHNMHQAYERLRFPEAGYGLFISGPSKTADIGQILVVGAQGARFVYVALIG